MTTTEPLTTGWEADLADSDTLGLRWLRHWSATCAAFVGALGGTVGTVFSDERYLLADAGRPASFFNAAVLLAPVGDLPGLLDEIEARVAGGSGDVYLWSLWPTPDLRPRGWELDGHPPLCVRPPLAVLPVPAPPVGPAPARVRTPEALARWERVLVDGYPVPDAAPARPGQLVGPALLDDDRVRFWSSGDPVEGISAQFVAHGIASFALGVTMPGARRRGHWYRHAHVRLHTEPGLWHAGVFADASRPGAERIGFVPVLRHTLWHLHRP